MNEVKREDLIEGRKYHVVWESCDANGSFTSNLRTITKNSEGNPHWLWKDEYTFFPDIKIKASLIKFYET